MFSHKVRRSIRASTLLCEKTGAEGPFGYRERRQTNSSARIRNCIARSQPGRSTLVGVVSTDVPVANAYFRDRWVLEKLQVPSEKLTSCTLCRVEVIGFAEWTRHAWVSLASYSTYISQVHERHYARSYEISHSGVFDSRSLTA
jgi:hypothetical protein